MMSGDVKVRRCRVRAVETSGSPIAVVVASRFALRRMVLLILMLLLALLVVRLNLLLQAFRRSLRQTVRLAAHLIEKVCAILAGSYVRCRLPRAPLERLPRTEGVPARLGSLRQKRQWRGPAPTAGDSARGHWVSGSTRAGRTTSVRIVLWARRRGAHVSVYLSAVEQVYRMRHLEDGAADWHVRLRPARFSSAGHQLQPPLLGIDFAPCPLRNVARHAISCVAKPVRPPAFPR